jgi:hypothetical protein
MADATVQRLLAIGFRDIGRWTVADREGHLRYVLDGPVPDADRALLDVRSALYAYVQGNDVLYVGKTARSLKRRLQGYCTPGKAAITNWKCNGNIRSLLTQGATVRIFIFAPSDDLKYGDFEIDLPAGLEEALISAFAPPWNGRDGAKPITEEAEREKVEEKNVESVIASQDLTTVAATAPLATFTIKLGTAYYDQGIVNPGVDASRYLGEDGQPLVIQLGKEGEVIPSRINRTANLGGSVRAVGKNAAIAAWFQRNFKRGDTVNAEVLGPHRIRLLAHQEQSA